MEGLKNDLENVFLWRSPEKFLWRPFFFIVKTFFWRALALVSLVLGLGHEDSCPWPRECLSSERLSLALDFFKFLALASSLVSLTPPLLTALFNSDLLFVFYCIVETFAFRVTSWLEDPKPVTSQHPCCLFESFTWCVLLIIDVS